MSEFGNDQRYALCSVEGRKELVVYLKWIKDNSLEDTEYSYVNYLLGRSRIIDARHLLAIWEHLVAKKIDRSTRSQIRRFFMNPSLEVGFNIATSAGWFDFIPSVYLLQQTVSLPNINIPTFVQVGSKEWPVIKGAVTCVNNEILLNATVPAIRENMELKVCEFNICGKKEIINPS